MREGPEAWRINLRVGVRVVERDLSLSLPDGRGSLLFSIYSNVTKQFEWNRLAYTREIIEKS